MSLYPKLDNLSLSKLIARFHSPPPDSEEYSYTYYAEVASLIRQKGTEGIQFLWREAENADTVKLRAILLASTEPPLEIPNLREILFDLLQDQRPLVVAEVIDSLTRQGEDRALGQVLPLLKHTSPYVKGSVLRFMSAFYPEQAIPLLMNTLDDPHFIVRENAADELGELEAIGALPLLEAKLSDPHPHVRQAVETAIEFLEPLLEDENEDIPYQSNRHDSLKHIDNQFHVPLEMANAI